MMDSKTFPFRLTAKDVKYELVNLKQLVFEVTDACNLRCQYCVFGEMYSGFDLRKSQFLPFKEARSVIDYLAELWNNNPNAASQSPLGVSFYGGEPLMNVTLIQQVVGYIRSLRIPKEISFSLTSNCVLLDRYMDFLVENDFFLLVSLDGDRQSDAYRVFHDGSPSFDRVFSNIKQLQSRYPDYFARNVQFNAVLHNRNDVPGILSFFKREFEKVPVVSELSTVGIREDQKAAFKKAFKSVQEDIDNAGNQEELRKEMKYDVPDTSELMYFFSTALGNVFDSYSDLLSPETDTPRMPTGTCVPFSRKLFVKVDGKILPCERIPHQFSAGTVEGERVNLDLQAVADQFNTYLDRIKPSCRECASMNHCKKCIYTIDGIETEKCDCDSFMDQSRAKWLEDYYKGYLFRHPTLYREFMEDVMTN